MQAIFATNEYEMQFAHQVNFCFYFFSSQVDLFVAKDYLSYLGIS